MEGHVWRIVCEYLESTDSNDGRIKCDLRDIMMILLWSTLNERPRRWALQEENWRFDPRPRNFICEGQLSRRARSALVQRQLEKVLARINKDLMETGQSSVTKAYVDGSPVAVGGGSGDPDAKAGRAVGRLARGYKIHLFCGEKREIFAFRVTSMNVYEGKPFVEMMAELPTTLKRVFADGNYDSSKLHQAAQAVGIQLIAPVRHNRVGRRGCPHRIAALRYLNTPRGKNEHKKRDAIERLFGNLKSMAFGLHGLPSWVRRIGRVTTWITAKMILYSTARLIKSKGN